MSFGRKCTLVCRRSYFPTLQVIEISSVVFPATDIKCDRNFLPDLQLIKQAYLILDKFYIDFLRVFSIFNDYNHFPLGEPAVEGFRWLNQLYLSG